jgi:uncharacterized protein (DUF2141 family)
MPGQEPEYNALAQGRRYVIAAIATILSALAIAAIIAVAMRSSGVHANVRAGANLAVTLNGIASNKGKVLAALCDKATFLKRCEHTAVQQAGPGVTLHFDGLAPGAYAVMVFHDENDNGEFDKSPNGMPREGYGFSRNARGHYGPPAFEDAAIELKPGTANLSIDLSY